MTKDVRRKGRFRPEKLVGFLEAVYRMDSDDQVWLRTVTKAALAVWGRAGWAHSAIYDASDITDFRVKNIHIERGPDGATALLARGLQSFTPDFVTRSFRTRLADASTYKVSGSELREMFEGMAALGSPDAVGINGMDPIGLGVFISVWRSVPTGPLSSEMVVYRRMAHHLAAAHSCRRRLREGHSARSTIDPPRDLASRTRASGDAGVRRWRPLTSARWTLVESSEEGDARSVVAAENQAQLPGLSALSERERQVVAYLAVGQSTKEISYALGISDATVRVLLARAVAKTGAKSRRALLQHPDVRRLAPLEG